MWGARLLALGRCALRLGAGTVGGKVTRYTWPRASPERCCEFRHATFRGVSIRSRFELSRGALRMLGIAFLALWPRHPPAPTGPSLTSTSTVSPRRTCCSSADRQRLDAGAIDTPSGVVRARMPREPGSVRGRLQRWLDADRATPPIKSTATPRDPTASATTIRSSGDHALQRLYAHDAVDERSSSWFATRNCRASTSRRRDPRARRPLYADMVVDLNASQRFESRASVRERACCRLRQPPSKFELLRDGADNWFIRAMSGSACGS